jgi:hypothetical protein
MMYPYTPYDPQPKDICKPMFMFGVGQKYRMSYYSVYNQETIKKIILKKPAVINVCGVDFLDYAPGETEQSKILKCKPSNVALNLAVLLVGYT